LFWNSFCFIITELISLDLKLQAFGNFSHHRGGRGGWGPDRGGRGGWGPDRGGRSHGGYYGRGYGYAGRGRGYGNDAF